MLCLYRLYKSAFIKGFISGEYRSNESRFAATSLCDFQVRFLYASFCAHCGMTGMTVGLMLITLWHCKQIKCWWYSYVHEMTKYVGKISPRNSRRLLRNTQTIFGEYFLPHPVVDRAHDATIASAFKLSAHLKRYWNKTVSKQFWNCFSFVSIKRTILRILYMQCFIEYVHLFIIFLLSVVRFCIGPIIHFTAVDYWPDRCSSFYTQSSIGRKRPEGCYFNRHRGSEAVKGMF